MLAYGGGLTFLRRLQRPPAGLTFLHRFTCTTVAGRTGRKGGRAEGLGGREQVRAVQFETILEKAKNSELQTLERTLKEAKNSELQTLERTLTEAKNSELQTLERTLTEAKNSELQTLERTLKEAKNSELQTLERTLKEEIKLWRERFEAKDMTVMEAVHAKFQAEMALRDTKRALMTILHAQDLRSALEVVAAFLLERQGTPVKSRAPGLANVIKSELGKTDRHSLMAFVDAACGTKGPGLEMNDVLVCLENIMHTLSKGFHSYDFAAGDIEVNSTFLVPNEMAAVSILLEFAEFDYTYIVDERVIPSPYAGMKSRWIP